MGPSQEAQRSLRASMLASICRKAGHKRISFRLDLGLVCDQLALVGLSEAGDAGDAASGVSVRQHPLDGDGLHLLADSAAGHVSR
jgi:hypothetical protein